MTKTIPLLALLCLALACAASVRNAQEPTSASSSPSHSEGSSDMMVIRVVLSIQPEHRTAFLEYLASETPEVRAMDGCEWYELFQDPNNEDRFLLYEEWSSAEAFEAYKATESFSQAFAVLGPMMAGPPSSSYFNARPEE